MTQSGRATFIQRLRSQRVDHLLARRWAFGGKGRWLTMVRQQIIHGERVMMKNMMKIFLLAAGVFLIPVALTYGVDPAATLPKFMNITVEGTDQTHIFRALSCLYLGVVAFCIIAAFTPGVAACGSDLGGVFRFVAGHRADHQHHRRRHAKRHPPLLFGRRAYRGHAWASAAQPRGATGPSLGD
jgi:Domain of unknown function (DUF4345)